MSDFSASDPGFAPEVSAPAEPGFDALESEYDKLLAPPDEQIPVSRAQLQKMAAEHKSYRQKWGNVAREWDGVPEDDIKGLSAFYRALASGNRDAQTQAREWINGVFDSLTPAEEKALNEGIKAEAKATGQTVAEVKADLTPDEIQKMIEERTQQALKQYDAQKTEAQMVEQNVRLLQNGAAKLAEEYGIQAWATPGSRLYDMLMRATSESLSQAGGDLEVALNKAAVSLLEDLQAANVAVVSKKKATAGAGAKPTPSRGTEPASGRDRPSDWADARARALERMMQSGS